MALSSPAPGKPLNPQPSTLNREVFRMSLASPAPGIAASAWNKGSSLCLWARWVCWCQSVAQRPALEPDCALVQILRYLAKDLGQAAHFCACRCFLTEIYCPSPLSSGRAATRRCLCRVHHPPNIAETHPGSSAPRSPSPCGGAASFRAAHAHKALTATPPCVLEGPRRARTHRSHCNTTVRLEGPRE